jgi:hypothetical protein
MVTEEPAQNALDLDLVAHIVRRAGLDCRIDGDPTVTVVRARRADCTSSAWTVVAGVCGTGPAPPLAYVGPAGSASTNVVRGPDERHLAALVVLQALRAAPHELLTHDEASASGLGVDLIRPRRLRLVGG